jgi:hypothetical protein
MFVKDTRPGPTVVFTTPYQVVMLTNNNIYVGKLEGYGTPRPVLTDVYIIVTQNNPDTKQSSKVLVKLNKIELNSPDRMYLNPNQILAVEPVDAKSQIAQTLEQQPGH